MYSKAISWIDDCRIPFVDDSDMTKPDYANKLQMDKPKHTPGAMTGGINKMLVCNPQGRFPANILVSDDMLNDGNICKSNDNVRRNKKSYMIYNQNEINTSETKGFNDKGTNSRYYDIDKWFDKIIDG